MSRSWCPLVVFVSVVFNSPPVYIHCLRAAALPGPIWLLWSSYQAPRRIFLKTRATMVASLWKFPQPPSFSQLSSPLTVINITDTEPTVAELRYTISLSDSRCALIAGFITRHNLRLVKCWCWSLRSYKTVGLCTHYGRDCGVMHPGELLCRTLPNFEAQRHGPLSLTLLLPSGDAVYLPPN